FWLGTVKVPPYSNGTCSSLTTEFYDPKTFITHAASLRQTCVHCGRFPTAASRRSLGRVSVPVWPITLSGRLRIVALVGFYPTNQLMRHRPVSKWLRMPPFILLSGDKRLHPVLAHLFASYPSLAGKLPTSYTPIRRSFHTRPSEDFCLLPARDLQVLGTPPAFVLSQDQTLHKVYRS